MTARDDVLGRIRTALAGQPPAADVPREYRTAGEHAPGAAAVLELLTDRLVDYKATVVPSASEEVPDAVARVLADRGTRHDGGRVLGDALAGAVRRR